MNQYQTFTLCLQGPSLTENWAVPDLKATFTHAGIGTTVEIPGFYDGDGVYKIRFLPEEPGEYTWDVSGCVNAEGRETCLPADEHYHGKIITQGISFCHSDGARYLPFGTTVYALAHQPDELVAQTLETLEAAPFNKIRMCVFPKHYDYNHNDPPCFPFEKNEDGGWAVERPSLAFWHRFEHILDKLEEMDIQVDLILFHPYDCWGFSKMTMARNFIYLETVLRRLAGRPNIWWSMANEYDLLPARKTEDWYAIEEFIAAHDPFHHLLSNHACMKAYDFSRPNITHICLQTTWVEKADSYVQEFGKPVVYDEMCYEGNLVPNWGNLSAFEMVSRFWCVCTKGAYGTHGETFLAQDDVLWWAKGGVLKGQSPARIAWLKELLYSLPAPITANSRMAPPPEMLANPDAMEKLLANQPEETRLFARVMASMPEREREMFFLKNTQYAGHCGEDAYLWYFAHSCPGQMPLRLPEGKRYRVEVLDAWEMTRTPAGEFDGGAHTIALPGKEGIAVLATYLPKKQEDTK